MLNLPSDSTRPVYSVSELNNYIKNILESVPRLTELCVKGELSNYKIYPSGHHYFTLKDKDSALRCVMFKGSAMKLRFTPENGMSVTCSGSISVFPRDGAYQLYCTSIMPEGTGDLQVAFEQLKAKLAAEGLFEERYKKPLPRFPERIAIITSSAGAAVHDMIRILSARWPSSKVIVLPVRVQGVEAPPEIVGAIRYANEFNIADVIITGRGGGSIEDLWAFNDERVARAIFASEIPVISAVGHEPDVTISDYVADRRASTPSNAAEIAVPDVRDIIETLSSYEVRSYNAINKRLSSYADKLQSIRQKRVLSDPMNYLASKQMVLDRYRDALLSAEERLISSKKNKFVALAAGIDAMSPLRVLTRGYAVATDKEGKLIKSVAAVSVGEDISLELCDGVISCTVSGKTENRTGV